MKKYFLLILLCSQLIACGIKGGLYLPPEPEMNDPEANEATA